MAENRHSGISMHKLTIGSGFIGFVFTVGCALIFLLGLPQLWCFVAFSGALGVTLAVIFRLIAKNRTERMKPLSILDASEAAKAANTKQDRQPNIFRALPSPHSA